MEIQETKDITLPITKKKVTLRGYLTGRVKEEIKRIYMKSATVEARIDDGEMGEMKDVNFDASADVDATYKRLELLVLKVEGCPDGGSVLDYILDVLPEEDYDYLKDEVDKIEHPLPANDSKKSETSTIDSSNVAAAK